MRSVLLITIDSLRADHLSSYGYERETTPHIDGVGADGHLLEQAFAHGPTTRKSFPTILTSSYPLMYGGYDRISEQRTLISELLDDAGYRTAGFHSNPYLSEQFGYARGFDTLVDSASDSTATARLRQAVKNNLDEDGALFRFLKWAFDRTEETVGVEVGSAYTDAETLTDRALETLQGMPAEEPVFLWVHYMDVHHPYLPPEGCQREFRDSPIPERHAVQLRRKMLEAPDEVTDDERQQLVDLYDAEIRYTDREIGRLLEGVERARPDDPVVVVTADHGEEFADHGGYSHDTVHDEGIHVPLIVDDGDGSGRYDDVVGLLDVAPTLVEYAGLDQPETFYGYSLRRLFDGEAWPRESVIGELGQPEPGERNFFYRSADWKYMHWADGSEELYDIQADPGERDDIVDEEPPALAEIRAEIDDHVERLDETRTDVGDVEMTEEVQERLEMLGYKE
jgi:arylsulfatase A-like enzyme